MLKAPLMSASVMTPMDTRGASTMQDSLEPRTRGVPPPACIMVVRTSHFRIPVCHTHAIFQPFASATLAA